MGPDLQRAIEASPDHVSCYALTVEPGTPLNRAVMAGAAAPDPDIQADRYETAEKRWAKRGYQRYEVSNWSRPGHECRYNLTVWAQGQYEAYGNGAHRFRDGVRSHNVRRLDAYISEIEAGRRPIAGAEPMRGWDSEIDRLFVGLRRADGVVDGPGVWSLIASDEGKVLQEAGVIEMRADRLVVKRPLLTDMVHRAVLGLEAPRGMGGSIQCRITCRHARRSSLRDPQGTRGGAHPNRGAGELTASSLRKPISRSPLPPFATTLPRSSKRDSWSSPTPRREGSRPPPLTATTSTISARAVSAPPPRPRSTACSAMSTSSFPSC